MASLFLKPFVIRSALIELIKSMRLGGYPYRLAIGAVPRPYYGYIVYQAARLARQLDYKRISVLEFGVAGGRGLLNLEYHARQVERILPVKIELYGFDTGEGLPPPVDYRDLPYHWQQGFFRMDPEALRAKLRSAKLILGNISDTARRFLHDHDPAPIGAVIHDFDFYSSTAAALAMFDEDQRHFLPRVFCYFDDITGTESSLYNDYTGERLAIHEFNRAHELKKLSPAYHLLSRKLVQPWFHQIFIYHDFKHPRYNDFVSDEARQIPL
jgi:hypothetical protein